MEKFKNSSINQSIVDSETLTKWGCQIAKNQELEKGSDPLLEKAQEWLKENLNRIVASTKVGAADQDSLQTKIQDACSKIQKADQNQTHSSLPADIQVKYIQATDSLLIQKGEYIKLVNRNNGTFNLADVFSFNRPITPRDQVSLLLNLKDLQLLLQKLSTVQGFAQSLDNSARLLGLCTFLEAIIAAQTQNHIYSNHLLVAVAYKHAKRAADTLLEFLENSAQWLNSLLQGETENKKCIVSRNIGGEELATLLNFVAGIDEALYAMIHHEDAQDKLFAYWQGSNARAFSSFERVETLSSLADSQFDIIRLSDSGLLSTDFITNEFKHYDNASILIDSEKILHSSASEIESLIQNQVTQVSKNVPLSVTLSNFPPQKQIEESKTILVPQNTSYAVNVSKKGEVSLWNTNKTLVFLCKDDFAKPLVARKPVLFQTSKDKTTSSNPPAAQAGFGFGGGGFGGGFGGGGFGFGTTAAVNTAANQNQEPEELEEDDGTQKAGTAQPAPGGFGAAPAGGFGFGAPAGGFGFGAPAGGFGFGATPVTPATTFGFGSTSAGGLFGATPADEKPKAKPKAQKTDEATTKEVKEEKKPEGETVEAKKEDAPVVEQTSSLFGAAPSQSSSLFGSTPIVQEDESDSKKEKENDSKKETEEDTSKKTDLPVVKEEKEEAAPTTSVFGSTTTTTAFGSTTTSSFSFGAGVGATTQPVSFGFGAPATTFGTSTASTGFSFGTPAATTGFSFGAPATTTGFSFGAPAAKSVEFGAGQGLTFGGPITPVPAENSAAEKAAIPLVATIEESKNNDLKGYDVIDHLAVSSDKLPLSPLIVGLCFKKEDRVLLRLRRFGYSPSYINKFFYKHPTQGLYSLLNSQYFDPSEFSRIQKHLTQDYRLMFTTLEPMLYGRFRYKNQKTCNKFVQSEWISFDETDVKLPFSEVLGFRVFSNNQLEENDEINKIIAVGKKDNQIVASILKVKILEKGPYGLNYPEEKSFNVQPLITKTLEAPITADKDIKVFAVNKHIVLVESHSNKLYILNEELELVKTHETDFNIQNVKSLGQNILGFVDDKNTLHILNYSKASGETSSSSTLQETQDTLKTITENPAAHLEVISNTLNNPEFFEKSLERIHLSVNQFGQSFKLQQNAALSRLELKLQFVQNLENQTLTEQEETTLRTALNSRKTSPAQASSVISSSKEFPLFVEDVKYLPIIVDQLKGGAFSQLQPAALMTSPGLESFATKYADAQFVFKHLHDQLMFVNSVTIASPTLSIKPNSFPVESGLIYLLNDSQDLKKLAYPNISSENEFRAWYSSHEQDQNIIRPAGFFTLGTERETGTFELLEKRQAKYVVLKPTRLRNEGKLLNARDHPVEISFFGLQGLSCSQSTLGSSYSPKTLVESENISVNVSLSLEAQIDGKWVPLSNISQVKITNLSFGLGVKSLSEIPQLKKVPLTANATLTVSHEALEKNQVSQLRFSSSTQKSDWNISAVDICPVALQIKNNQTLSRESAQTLKNQIVFESKNQDFFKQLTTQVCSETATLPERRRIAQFLVQTLSINPSLKELVLKTLNLQAYVTLNILSDINNSSLYFLLLLREVSGLQTFGASLSQVLSEILPQLFQVPNLTSHGIKLYFTLLTWISSPQDVSQILKELKNSYKQLALLRTPEYKILRTQYNLPLFSFEKTLYDENLILQVSSSAPLEKISTLQPPIECKFLHSSPMEGDEYIIDLLQVHNVSRVSLWFPEYDKICSLRVQVWNVTDDSQKLLVSKYFNESQGLWLQLTRQAHEPSLNKFFEDQNLLSVLGFEVNETARYLRVQVTYSFRAGVANLLKDNGLIDHIMPIIHGEPAQNQQDISVPDIAKRFENQTEGALLNTVEVGSLLTYEKYEAFNKETQYTYLCKSSSLKSSATKPETEAELVTRLLSLQEELTNRLHQQRNSKYFFQSHNLITVLVSKIQNIQIKLYNHSLLQQTARPVESGHSPVALLALIEAISQYVLKLIAQNNKLEQKYFDTSDVKEIFDSIFLHEASNYTGHLQKLFSDWIWPSLSAQDKKNVLDTIFSTYLTSSISITHQPAEKLYSTLPAVTFLVNCVAQEPEYLHLFLEKLGEISSLVGNTYALIVIHEFYLKVDVDNQPLNKLNGQVLEALIRNLHYTIETPEFMATEKQYAVGFITDILISVVGISEPEAVDCLYKSPKELFRVFHYVNREGLHEIQDKLLHVLKASSNSIFKKFRQHDGTRMGAIATQFDQPYATFFFGTLKELFRFARGETKVGARDSPVEYFSEEITKEEWLDLTRIFLSHFVSVLYEDVTERMNEQKALKKQLTQEKNKKAKEKAAQEEKEKKEAEEKKAKTDDTTQISQETGEIKEIKEEGEEEDAQSEEKEDEGLFGSNAPVEWAYQGSLEEKGTLKRFLVQEGKEASQQSRAIAELIKESLEFLFKQKQGYDFSESQDHWLLFFKLIFSFKYDDLLSEQIVFRLIEAFVNAPANIQKFSSSPMVIHLTTLKSFSTELISRLASLSEQVDSGALKIDRISADTFLTGAFKNIYQFVRSDVGETHFAYNETLLLKVLKNLQGVLEKSLNFGTKRALNTCKEEKVPQMEKVDQMFKLLTVEPKKEKCQLFSIPKLIENYPKNKEAVDLLVNNFMLWDMFNKQEKTSTGAFGSASNSVFTIQRTIGNRIKNIFQLIAKNKEATYTALQNLLANFGKILNILSDLTCKRTIPGFDSQSYIQAACQSFEDLFSLWVTSDAAAEYFASELNGFEYLLKILDFKNIGEAEPSQFFQSNEITEFMTKRFSKTYSHTYQFGGIYSDLKLEEPEMKPNEEEFANKVKILNAPHQQWPEYFLDLTAMKQNQGQKAISFSVEGEYVLNLEFDRVFELKNISMHFANFDVFAGTSTSCIPEVSLAVGRSLDSLVFVGSLPRRNTWACSNQTAVFLRAFDGFNTDKFKTGQIDEWFRSIENRQVKFIQLRFKKPLMQLTETGSIQDPKPSTAGYVSINSISVTGIDVSSYGKLITELKTTTQTTALNVIQLLSTKFAQTWKQLADKEFLLEKSEKTLDAISNLLDLENSLVNKILLSIFKYNNSLSTWFFEHILQSSNAKKYSLLISDLLVNEPAFLVPRLEKLNQFIIKQAKNLSLVKSVEQHLQEFETFLQFVEILTSTANVIPQEFVGKGIHIDHCLINTEHLLNIFQKFNDLTSNAIKIAKLVIIYVFCPKPFVTTDTNVLKGFLELTLSMYKTTGHLDLLKLLTLIGVGSTQASKWLLDHIDTIFEKICALISENLASSSKNLIVVFIILNNLVSVEPIKKKFIKENWHIRLLNLFKVDPALSQTKILKTDDPETLKNLNVFLKSVVLDYSDQEEELARVLKDDIVRLKDQADNAFLEHFLLPLLKAEPELPVCLFPYDYSSKQWIGDLQSNAVASKPLDDQPFSFTSRLLKGDRTKALNKVLTRVTKKAKTYDKYCAMGWKKVYASKKDGDPKFESTFKNSLAGKGPFMIIIEGLTNSSGGGLFGSAQAQTKAVCGVFCGSPFPKIPKEQENNFHGNISKCKDYFVFYYDDTSKYHFTSSTQENIANIGIYPHGSNINFLYNNYAPIYLSISQSANTYCSFDLFSMQPMEGAETSKYINVNNISAVEVYLLDSSVQASSDGMSAAPLSVFKPSNLLRPDLFNENFALNFYRPMPVYNVPASLSIQDLASLFFKKGLPLALKATHEPLQPNSILSAIQDFVKQDLELNNIVDLEFDFSKYLQVKHQIVESQPTTTNSSSNMTIFNAFKRHKGIDALLELAVANVEKWKRQKLREVWSKWIVDLKNMSEFPNFFEAFVKNNQCIDLLFQILFNKPEEDAQKDEDDALKWQDEGAGAHKYLYRALADSIKMSNNINTGSSALATSELEKILNVLAIITKEKPRKWYANPDEEEEVKSVTPQSSPERKQEEAAPAAVGFGGKKVSPKKKGVGYGSDYNAGGGFGKTVAKPGQDWNVEQFVEKKRMKNEQIIALVNVLSSVFEAKNWDPSPEMAKLISESALLPLLESAFRNGSLIDMGKESDLYLSYLSIFDFVYPQLTFESRTCQSHQYSQEFDPMSLET